MPILPAKQTLEARQQNSEIKRLRKIVVGARFKSFEYILRPASRGEHQQRNVVPRFAQFARDCEAVLARQHHIEHERFEIRIVFQQQIERLFALPADVDGVAFRLEIKAQSFREMRFVFDDEDAAHAR